MLSRTEGKEVGMPFTQSAESLRSKLHLTDAKTSSIVGVCLAAAIAVVLMVQSAIGLASSESTEVIRAKDAASATGGDAGADAGADGAEGDVLHIYVHVAGAVTIPGLYELADGSRVQDAIDAAGGYADDAATAVLNLARVVSDGEQIVVPSIEADAADGFGREPGEDAAGGAPSAASAADGSVIGGKVNINVADASALDTLPGIGEATAENIIADREANGPFSSKEDLQRVSGIGAKKYARLEALICIG